MKWLYLLAAILCTAVANVLLKKQALMPLAPDPQANPLLNLAVHQRYFLGGIVCLGVAVIAYALCLRSFQLSVAYPTMTSSVIVLVTLASIFLFNEPVTLIRVVGAALIILGVVLISQ